MQYSKLYGRRHDELINNLDRICELLEQGARQQDVDVAIGWPPGTTGRLMYAAKHAADGHTLAGVGEPLYRAMDAGKRRRREEARQAAEERRTASRARQATEPVVDLRTGPSDDEVIALLVQRMTYDEAADQLGCSRATIYNRVSASARVARAADIGRRWRRQRLAMKYVRALREHDSIGEVAAALGVSRQQIYSMAKNHHVVRQAFDETAEKRKAAGVATHAQGQADRYEPDRECTIYVVAEEGGEYLKVGRTRQQLKKRIKKLRCGNPRTLTVLKHWQATYAEERRLHRALMRWHVRGEWFRATPEVRRLLGVDSDQMGLV